MEVFTVSGLFYTIWNGYGMVNFIWTSHSIHMNWCLIRFHMNLDCGLHGLTQNVFQIINNNNVGL